jgi:hypothetical protein
MTFANKCHFTPLGFSPLYITIATANSGQSIANRVVFSAKTFLKYRCIFQVSIETNDNREFYRLTKSHPLNIQTKTQ